MDAVKSGVAHRIEVLLLMLPPLMLLLPLLLLLMLPPLILSDDLLSQVRGYLLTHIYILTLSLHALLTHSLRHLYLLL